MRILNYLYLFSIAIFFQNFLMSEENYTIHTSSGVTSGIVKKGVITWHDVPYAEPPIGELRWKSPRNFLNQDLVIQNKEENYCVQQSSSLGGASGEGDIVGQEDCLYLDIRKPKNSNKNLKNFIEKI